MNVAKSVTKSITPNTAQNIAQNFARKMTQTIVQPGKLAFLFVLGVSLGNVLGIPGTMAQDQPNCSIVEQISSGNTVRQGETVILGRSPDRRYIVLVPTGSMDILKIVQVCIPDAFMTQSKLGAYIHAGSFANLNHAESLAAALRSRGLDARVIYAQ
jgi:formyltetrahydrofolate synthetase